MSISQPITITCPKCHTESEYVMWESINTMLDPEMKSAVRDGSAFLFTCPECGAKTNVDYGFLYHQMEDRIMIHYASSDENAKEIYDFVTGKTIRMMVIWEIQKMMLRFSDYCLSHAEVPEEASICIYITCCPNHCKDCHYPELQQPDFGELLGERIDTIYDFYGPLASCVCFGS